MSKKFERFYPSAWYVVTGANGAIETESLEYSTTDIAKMPRGKQATGQSHRWHAEGTQFVALGR